MDHQPFLHVNQGRFSQISLSSRTKQLLICRLVAIVNHFVLFFLVVEGLVSLAIVVIKINRFLIFLKLNS